MARAPFFFCFRFEQGEAQFFVATLDDGELFRKNSCEDETAGRFYALSNFGSEVAEQIVD